MKAKWGGVKVQLAKFLNMALDGGEWSCSCPYCFTPNKGVLVSIEQEDRQNPKQVQTPQSLEICVLARSKTMPDFLGCLNL